MRDLRRHLIVARDRMKTQADKHMREVVFDVEDYVFLKLQLYREKSVAFRSSLKLAPHFYGPFKILARIGVVAYKLELPRGSQIHDVIHVSLLKKQLGPGTSVISNLPKVTEDLSILPQLETILDSRNIKKGTYRPKTEVLVKWAGTTREDATWENLWRFSKTYPDFILEDKDILSGKD